MKFAFGNLFPKSELQVHVWLKVCHDQQLCSGKMNCTTFYTKYFMYFSLYSWCKLGIFWGSFFATLKFIFLLLFSLVILYYMICIVASCKAKILKNFSQNRLCMKSSMMIDLLTFFWFSFWSLIFWEWPFHFVVESWHAFRLMFLDHTSKSN